MWSCVTKNIKHDSFLIIVNTFLNLSKGKFESENDYFSKPLK